MHVCLDLCTIVDVNAMFSEISIGGHVSAQGAETLTWVIFKDLILPSESINGVFVLLTVDCYNRM